MFSKTIISTVAIAAVSASSIAPPQAETTSTLGSGVLDAIKQTIAPCASPDSYVEPDMYLLKCVETTLVSEISLLVGKVQPFLMFTPYGDAVETGITTLDTVVQDCVSESTTSATLAACHRENTEEDTVLRRFVDHFVVPVADCEAADDVLSCMNTAIDEGLVKSRPTIEAIVA